MEFQVVNFRTGEVLLKTSDVVAAAILADRENYKEVGVGYEPTWEVRMIQDGRTFRITVEWQFLGYVDSAASTNER